MLRPSSCTWPDSSIVGGASINKPPRVADHAESHAHAAPQGHHTAKVTPITKIRPDFVPMRHGTPPSCPHKIEAMESKYKCVDCGGHRVFGVGNPASARVGFPNEKFYFCSACHEWLQKKHRERVMKKMTAAEHAAAVAESVSHPRAKR